MSNDNGEKETKSRERNIIRGHVEQERKITNWKKEIEDNNFTDTSAVTHIIDTLGRSEPVNAD